jgi:predicted nucleotidyltransferase
MADSILTAAERTFLGELDRRGVRFMVVGMSAALIQGARGATEDIDLWFEDVTDPRIGEAAREAGGIWVSGAFAMGPPRA